MVTRILASLVMATGCSGAVIADEVRSGANQDDWVQAPRPHFNYDYVRLDGGYSQFAGATEGFQTSIGVRLSKAYDNGFGWLVEGRQLYLGAITDSDQETASMRAAAFLFQEFYPSADLFGRLGVMRSDVQIGTRVLGFNGAFFDVGANFAHTKTVSYKAFWTIDYIDEQISTGTVGKVVLTPERHYSLNARIRASTDGLGLRAGVAWNF